jgi:pilus assembly protein CpaE
MQVYFYTAGIESSELNELEGRIRSSLPNLRKVAKLDEVARRLGQHGEAADHEQNYIIFPVLAVESFDRIANIADQEHPGLFFIFVSKEISASDYKRLVRSRGADWAPVQNAPQEILDIISRTGRTESITESHQQGRPSIVAFVPSGGGVGNATIAIETAMQIKLNKQTRQQRVCLLDLDLQTSHVCDYLDIEPRFQIQEIIQNPDRLDAQLFDLFVSRHAASGVDVLATPRSRRNLVDLNMTALDRLFQLISERYDVVIVDLPPAWGWTDQVISVCDLAVITGFNNVPSLRRIVELIQEVKGVGRDSLQILVALNRCESGLVGGIARRQHVTRALGSQSVVYIREDAAAANHSLNTGVPISMASPSNRIVKDIRALVSKVSELRPTNVPAAGTPKRISSRQIRPV